SRLFLELRYQSRDDSKVVQEPVATVAAAEAE
ncbi:hypothetical protein Tco_1478702, partial [Tanacetum coccineum]